MSPLRLEDLRPDPGVRSQGLVTVPLEDFDWKVPVIVARGARPGPTLAITSGIHGAEYAPIEALTRFCRDLALEKLRGTVKAVLVVNTPGFYERSIYTNPVDGRNLNRAFPGSPDGLVSERVANFILAQVIRPADAYVDLHCGDLVETLTPFAIWTRTGREELDRKAEAMAQAYGLDYVMAMSRETIRGTASGSAAELGIPAITAEAGQQGICDPASLQQHLSGLGRVLGLLGMSEGEPSEGPRSQELHDFIWNRAQASGSYHPAVSVGDHVQEGEIVGRVDDLLGDKLSEVRAAATGVVMFCVSALAVKENDPLLGIGV